MVEKVIEMGDCIIKLIDNTEEFFTAGENESIIYRLREIAADSFGVEIEDKSLEGIRDHVIHVDVCALGYINKVLIGFASVRILHELDILFVHGIAVLMDEQTKGAGSKLLKALIEHYTKNRLAFTTQNPVMYDVIKKFCRDVYPSLEQKGPEKIQGIGCKLMEGRRGVFNPRTFVSQNLYSCCLYDSIPLSKKQFVNEWFDRVLRIQNRITSDGILLIGKL